MGQPHRMVAFALRGLAARIERLERTREHAPAFNVLWRAVREDGGTLLMDAHDKGVLPKLANLSALIEWARPGSDSPHPDPMVQLVSRRAPALARQRSPTNLWYDVMGAYQSRGYKPLPVVPLVKNQFPAAPPPTLDIEAQQAMPAEAGKAYESAVMNEGLHQWATSCRLLAGEVEQGEEANAPASARRKMDDAGAMRVAGEIAAIKRRDPNTSLSMAATLLTPPVNRGTLSRWMRKFPVIAGAWGATDSTPEAHARKARDG